MHCRKLQSWQVKMLPLARVGEKKQPQLQVAEGQERNSSSASLQALAALSSHLRMSVSQVGSSHVDVCIDEM